MEGKKLIILAGGILVVALVVLAAAFVVLNNGSPAASPTPAPEATPASATGGPTATQGSMTNPTLKPNPTDTPTAAPGGPIIVQTNYNRTMGICFVSIFPNTGASPIDTGTLKMDIVCDGQTYRNVWTPKVSDWANSDKDTLLEPNEVLTTQIDTKAAGIPQGRPITIKILQDSAVLQETTVTPT